MKNLGSSSGVSGHLMQPDCLGRISAVGGGTGVVRGSSITVSLSLLAGDVVE